MSDGFEFATAMRVVFGAGKAHTLGDHLGELQVTRVLAVTGRDRERSRDIWDSLRASGVALEFCTVAQEPTVELVREGVRICRASDAQAVVAVGGGSALDAGKAIAILSAHPGDALDYLEVVGRGQALRAPGLPFVALPTTAGTGAEVTRNAVLSAEEHGVKASLRSVHMLPKLAIVDPDFLCAAPPSVLRASGLDALSQLIEPFVSIRNNPLCDALARAGIERSRRSLRAAVLHGPDAQQREDLALASLFGGLCLANAGLGAVHGFAAPLGGSFHAPHGAVCAALLPHVMEANVQALRARAPESALLARYDELARLLTGDPRAEAEAGSAWVRELCRALAVPGLSAYGMTRADIPALVEKATRASSMRANSIVLTVDELSQIAEAALA